MQFKQPRNWAIQAPPASAEVKNKGTGREGGVSHMCLCVFVVCWCVCVLVCVCVCLCVGVFGC